MKFLFPVALTFATLVGVPLAVQQLKPGLASWGRPATASASIPLPAWEPYLPVPGAPARMIVPDGFWLHPTRVGYRNPQRDASLVMLELDEPFAQMRPRLEPEALAARGMTLQSTTPVRIDNVPGLLIRATRSRSGETDQAKLIAAVGDHRRSILLIATHPSGAEPQFSQAMEKALLSARFEPGKRPDVMGGLPLRIEPAEGFIIAGRTGAAATFTRDGRLPTGSQDRATFLVGIEQAGGEIIDRKAFAQARLAQFTGVRDLLVHAGNYASVAGLPAYEIVATAVLNDRDEPCIIHQTLAFDGRTVYILQGLALYANGPRCLEEFRAMTGTLRLRN